LIKFDFLLLRLSRKKLTDVVYMIFVRFVLENYKPPARLLCLTFLGFLEELFFYLNLYSSAKNFVLAFQQISYNKI